MDAARRLAERDWSLDPIAHARVIAVRLRSGQADPGLVRHAALHGHPAAAEAIGIEVPPQRVDQDARDRLRLLLEGAPRAAVWRTGSDDSIAWSSGAYRPQDRALALAACLYAVRDVTMGLPGSPPWRPIPERVYPTLRLTPSDQAVLQQAFRLDFDLYRALGDPAPLLSTGVTIRALDGRAPAQFMYDLFEAASFSGTSFGRVPARKTLRLTQADPPTWRLYGQAARGQIHLEIGRQSVRFPTLLARPFVTAISSFEVSVLSIARAVSTELGLHDNPWDPNRLEDPIDDAGERVFSAMIARVMGWLVGDEVLP